MLGQAVLASTVLATTVLATTEPDAAAILFDPATALQSMQVLTMPVSTGYHANVHFRLVLEWVQLLSCQFSC